MSGELEVYRHSVVGFEIPLPTGWKLSEEQDGCALVAVEPPREEPHLRASVVVTIEAPAVEQTFDEWTERSVTALQDSLNRLRIIDDEPVEIAGAPARRVLSHYVHPQFGGVNLEQWLLAHGGLGYTISCSSAALEYDDVHEVMSAIAEGVKPA